MPSFKYPCIDLGGCTDFSKIIKQNLALIEAGTVGTYECSIDGVVKIEAQLYADLKSYNGHDYGATSYFVFLDYANYMFSFETIGAALDCIQNFKSIDIHQIVTELDEKRMEVEDLNNIWLESVI